MSRRKVIQLLVSDRLKQRDHADGHRWLEKVIEAGFVGYANLSDEELAAEFEWRGLELHDEPRSDEERLWDEEAAQLAADFRDRGELQNAP